MSFIDDLTLDFNLKAKIENLAVLDNKALLSIIYTSRTNMEEYLGKENVLTLIEKLEASFSKDDLENFRKEEPFNGALGALETLK